MSILALFSSWPFYRGEPDAKLSETEKLHTKIKLQIDRILQQPEPTEADVLAARQICCHPILGGLYFSRQWHQY
jgi:hypothetical protein